MGSQNGGKKKKKKDAVQTNQIKSRTPEVCAYDFFKLNY
jgi:hypothetical protein